MAHLLVGVMIFQACLQLPNVRRAPPVTSIQQLIFSRRCVSKKWKALNLSRAHLFYKYLQKVIESKSAGDLIALRNASEGQFEPIFGFDADYAINILKEIQNQDATETFSDLVKVFTIN